MPTVENVRLVDALGSEPRRPDAFRELLRRGTQALPDIRQGLRHPHAPVREECCRLLDQLLAPEAVDDLTAMLDDPDPRVRVAALHQNLARGRPALAGWGMASEFCSDLNWVHGSAPFT